MTELWVDSVLNQMPTKSIIKMFAEEELSAQISYANLSNQCYREHYEDDCITSRKLYVNFRLDLPNRPVWFVLAKEIAYVRFSPRFSSETRGPREMTICIFQTEPVESVCVWNVPLKWLNVRDYRLDSTVGAGGRRHNHVSYHCSNQALLFVQIAKRGIRNIVLARR